MKKSYNAKYKSYCDLNNDITQIGIDIEVINNRMFKLHFKKKNIMLLVDNNFYSQFEVNLKRVPIELISYLYEFFGFFNHHHKSVKVNYILIIENYSFNR